MPKYSGFDPIESHNVLTTSTTIGGTSHTATGGETVLYLPFDSDINDASSFNHTITSENGAVLSSTQSKFGGSSLRVDDDPERITVTDAGNFNFGTLDFTIEGWFRFTEKTGPARLIHGGNNSSSLAPFLFYLSNDSVYFYSSSDGSNWNISNNKRIAENLSTNTWYHLAVTREGDTFRCFQNGTLKTTFTSSSALMDVEDGAIAIGGRPTELQSLSGYIDDLRIIRGHAKYTAAFTAPTSAVGLHNGNPVSLYLPFDSDVNDDSSHSHTVTASGSATISSTQAKFGGNSLSLNGTSQYLTVPNDSLFNFGSEDFTIEMWIYMTSNAGTNAEDRHALVARRASSSNRSFHVGIQSDGGMQKLQFSHSTNGTNGYQENYYTDLQLNTWTHIAIVRSGSKVYAFVDGIKNREEHDISTHTIYAGTSDLTIGYRGESSQYFPGYIDDLRISKGVARYTKSFIPPNAAVGATLSGENKTNTTTDFTSLYLPFDSDVQDDSPQSHTVTAYGNAAISSTQSKFGGYSLSLDGTGDYLRISPPGEDTSTEFGGTDLTIEAWLYQNDDTGHMIVCKRANSGQWETGAWLFGVNTNIAGSNDDAGKVQFWAYNYNQTSSLLEFDNGSAFYSGWHHFAVTRSSDVWMLFVDGTKVDTQEWTGSIGDNDLPLFIGKDSYNGGRYETNGYIDDFRILKGYAKYTGDFVPPTTAVGTSVSETENDLSILYMPFDGTETTSSISSSLTSIYLPFDSDLNDDSSNSHTVTAYGNAAISSTQSKFGGYSLYLSGTDDYLQIADNAAFEFGSGDWTLETFFYQNDNTGHVIAQKRNTNGTWGTGAWTLGVNTNYGVGNEIVGRIEFFSNEFNTGSPLLSYEKGSAFSSGWHHLALTRSGSSWKLFLDGDAVASATWSGTMSDASYPLTIGRDTYAGAGQRGYLNGYLDDFRIIKGAALYTESFTVPTSALGTTGTAISFAGGFEDLAKNHDVTKEGDTVLNTSVKKFGTSSVYFDGSGDRVLVKHGGNLNLSDNDFTIEGWFYFTSNLNAGFFNGDSGSANKHPWLLYTTSGGAIRFYATSDYSTWDVASAASLGTVSLNTWTHLAVTREGDKFRCFQDGVLKSTTTSSSSLYYNTDNQIAIGGRSGTNLMAGYADDLRIIKGKAVYTEAFTPPSSAHGTELSESTTSTATDTKALSSTWTMTNDGSSPRSFIDMRSDNTWANNEHLQSQSIHRWNPANGGEGPGTTATGGSIATPGNGYRYHVFTSPGTFQLSAIDGGSPSLAVEYLVVAGGGGGGADRAGGGGAGGLRTNEDGNPKAGSAMTIATGSFPVVVGTGGSGGVYPSPTTSDQGGTSSFNSISATGGGTAGINSGGGSGGSGGGGTTHGFGGGGSGNAGGYTPPEGNDGGAGGYPRGGGGGGGAGAAGSDAPNPSGGNGGAGHAMPSFAGPILSPVIPGGMATAIGPTGLYAGGGGGGGQGSGTGGTGGPGGGGNGGTANVPPSSYNPTSNEYGPAGAPGVDGTGGGGGGAGNFPGTNPNMRPGGDGGNGVVIIKYAY